MLPYVELHHRRTSSQGFSHPRSNLGFTFGSELKGPSLEPLSTPSRPYSRKGRESISRLSLDSPGVLSSPKHRVRPSSPTKAEGAFNDCITPPPENEFLDILNEKRRRAHEARTRRQSYGSQHIDMSIPIGRDGATQSPFRGQGNVIDIGCHAVSSGRPFGTSFSDSISDMSHASDLHDLHSDAQHACQAENMNEASALSNKLTGVDLLAEPQRKPSGSTWSSHLAFASSLGFAVVVPILCLVSCGPYYATNWKGLPLVVIASCLTVVMWVHMGYVILRNPGFLPQNMDPFPAMHFDEKRNELVVSAKYVGVQNGIIPCKWCETCRSYRGPRTTHCRICDRCVDGADHHCVFLKNCIGVRNYTSFLVFVFIALVLCVLLCVSVSISVAHEPLDSYRFIIGVISGSLAGLMALPLCALLCFHTFLITRDETTIEHLRPKELQKEAVELTPTRSRGDFFGNLFLIMCRPLQ